MCRHANMASTEQKTKYSRFLIMSSMPPFEASLGIIDKQFNFDRQMRHLACKIGKGEVLSTG